MNERCPVHRRDLVRTQDAFPGTPCTADFWCPVGHAARVWEIVNDWGEAELRRQPRVRRTPRQALALRVSAAAKLARLQSAQRRIREAPLRVCGRDAHGFAVDAR